MYFAPPNRQINLKVTASQHARLTEVAKAEDVTVQHLIRTAIEDLTGAPNTIRKDRNYRHGDGSQKRRRPSETSLPSTETPSSVV